MLVVVTSYKSIPLFMQILEGLMKENSTYQALLTMSSCQRSWLNRKKSIVSEKLGYQVWKI
jgi:hypothetical protein